MEPQKQEEKGRIFSVVCLHLMLALYSLSSVCAKLASGFDGMSLGFVLCYGAMIMFLGLYALGWQQIIKKLPLTFAYANKAVTVLWSIFWGVLLFAEKLTPLKVLGALIVLLGVVLYSASDEGAQS